MRFASEEGVKKYVEEELHKALPSGWIANFRLQYSNLSKDSQNLKLYHHEWKIAPKQDNGILMHDYLLRVTMDLNTFIIIHANSDAGAFSIHHMMLNAKVIYATQLDYFPLSEFIIYIMRNYQPNTWGLS
jgi:hypothetical protein